MANQMLPQKVKKSEVVATKLKNGFQVTFNVNGRPCPMINVRLKDEADVKALLKSKLTFA